MEKTMAAALQQRRLSSHPFFFSVMILGRSFFSPHWSCSSCQKDVQFKAEYCSSTLVSRLKCPLIVVYTVQEPDLVKDKAYYSKCNASAPKNKKVCQEYRRKLAACAKNVRHKSNTATSIDGSAIFSIFFSRLVDKRRSPAIEYLRLKSCTINSSNDVREKVSKKWELRNTK